MDKTQKEKLKNLVKIKTLEEAVEILGIDYEEAKKYLLKIWGKEKFIKIIESKKSKMRLTKNNSLINEEFNLKGHFFSDLKFLLFLFFLIFLVYCVALPGEFLSDDIATIAQNPKIFQTSYFFSSSFPVYFNPRNFILFLTAKVFGLNPLFFRITNIFSHIGVCFLIYFILLNFFDPFFSKITTTVYAVHPILIESVTWISGGPYTQSSFFILLSLLFWIIWNRTSQRKYFFFSFFSFLVSLTFSERLIWFVAVLFILEILQKKLKTNWKWLLPYFCLIIFWVALLLGFTQKRLIALQTDYYQELGYDNLLTKIPFAITSYLELILWPKRLTFYHSELSMSGLEYILRLIITLIFFSSIFYFFKKDKRVFFWLAFFVISLSPTLTPLRIAWVVAERYVYIGSIGVLVLVVWLLTKIKFLTKNKTYQYIFWGLIILSLGIRSIIRNLDWKNQDTLWLATAKYSPSSPQNHNNLGDLYARKKEYQKAINEFKRAIELKPNYADAYHNLANVYVTIGETESAKANYLKAINLNPRLWQSYQNLGVLYYQEKKFNEAQNYFIKAIEINPSNSQLHYALGIIKLELNEKEGALQEFEKTLQLDPNFLPAKEALQKISF